MTPTVLALQNVPTGEAVTFWVLAPLVVLAALGMVLVRSAVHSALLLAGVMLGLAVFYALEDAPFLAAVQIIVYTGAVMMLFLFVLMLVGVDSSDSLVETIKGQRFAARAGRGRLRRGRDHRGLAARSTSVSSVGLDGGQRRRQPVRAGQADLPQLRLPVRGHQRPADHRGARRHGAGPPRAHRAAAVPARAEQAALRR